MYYMFIILLTLTFGFDVYTQLGEYHVYSDKNKFDFCLKNCVLLMMIISSLFPCGNEFYTKLGKSSI